MEAADDWEEGAGPTSGPIAYGSGVGSSLVPSRVWPGLTPPKKTTCRDGSLRNADIYNYFKVLIILFQIVELMFS
jgi:hypothetical protein